MRSEFELNQPVIMSYFDKEIYEDHLKCLTTFEDEILGPLRVAKQFSRDDIVKGLRWAVQVDLLASYLDPNDPNPEKQKERLFFTLLDNPRFSEKSILEVIPVFKETEDEDIEPLKKCLQKREILKKHLFEMNNLQDQSLNGLPQIKILKEFIRSNRGDNSGCVDNKDILMEISKDVINSNLAIQVKVDAICHIFKKKEFNDKVSQRIFLEMIQNNEPSLLLKVYEAIKIN